MGQGPALHCSKCGRTFYGGKGYVQGRKNLCYECLVPMVDTISRPELEELGDIQRNFVGMIRQMGGLQAAGGKEYWVTMLKVNAGELSKDSMEDIEYLSADAKGIERDFEKLSINGCGAMLDKDYPLAARLFRQLVDKYPDEAAPYIRLCGALYKTGEISTEFLNLLNKAEILVKSGKSKHPMDKFKGLRDLYFFRAFYYAKSGENGKASDDLNKSLELDPDYKEAKGLKESLRSKVTGYVSERTSESANYCPKCDKFYDSSKKFCGKCGLPLGVDVGGQNETPQPSVAVEQHVLTSNVPKKDKLPVFVWLILVVLISGVGYLGYESFVTKKRLIGNINNSNQGQKATINKDVVLRQGLGSKSPSIGKLTANVQVAVIGSGTDSRGDLWNNVRVESGPLQGQVGYVKPKYLNGGGVSTQRAAAPAPSIQASLSQNIPPEFAREKIKDMLVSFINLANSKNYQILDMYADRVNTFNNKYVDKAALRKDEETYFNQWDIIKLVLMADFVISDVSSNQNLKKVEFRFNYQLENAQRTASGTSQTSWILESQGGQLKIVDQKEKIISNNVDAVSGNQQPSSASNSGGSDVESAVRTYYQAVQDKRVDDAVDMYCSQKRPNVKVSLIRAVAKDTEYYAIDGIEVRQNDDQQAETLVRLRHKKYKRPEEAWEIKITLLKENGAWKINGTPGRKI